MDNDRVFTDESSNIIHDVVSYINVLSDTIEKFMEDDEITLEELKDVLNQQLKNFNQIINE